MTKKISLYPQKDYAKKIAKDFIVQSKIKSLPINLFDVCKQHGYIIKSVSQTEDLINEIDPFDVRENPDCDAKTYLTAKGRYIIVYDDAVFSQGRITWTIAHEIGHIVLGHLLHFEQTEIHNSLTEEEHDVLEKEANAFASEFLAPAEILLNCNCVKKNVIIKLCGLSDEAASYREEYLKKYQPDDKYQHVNQKIHQQFYNFIQNKEFFHILHYKVCPTCKNYLFSTQERFCRICGSRITSRTLPKGTVHNDGPEMDKKKKVLICPKCLNPQNSKSALNCIHCGTALINRCENASCNKIHIGSSRYCYSCGHPTIFLSKGILCNWEKAQFYQTKQRLVKQQLEVDKETGKVFNDWHYLLSFIKKEGKLSLYHALKNSIAKIDYDTLFIYSDSDFTKSLIKDKAISDYIMKLFIKNLRIPVLEVLLLKIGLDGTITFQE